MVTRHKALSHKAHEMVLTNVRDTIHADSLELFALNIEILLADATKPEKSNIPTRLDLTCDVITHQWHLGQFSHHFWKVNVQGYRMAFEFLKSAG